MVNGKLVVVALGGILLGFLGGSWTSRSASLELELELKEAQAALKASQRKARSNLPMAMGLELMQKNLAASSLQDGSGTDLARQPKAGLTLPPDANDPEDEMVQDSAPSEALETDDQRQEEAERFDMMAGAWRLRAAQGRANFAENAHLSDEQQIALEDTTEEMNARVREVVTEALETIDFSREPEVRDLVDLAVTMGEVYQDTDDELREFIRPEQMASALESDFDIFSQIDPDVMMPLLQQLEQAD